MSDEATKLLRRLMEDTFSNWRTVPAARLTLAEQDTREFLLGRTRKNEGNRPVTGRPDNDRSER